MQIVQNSLEDKPIEDKLLQLLSKRKFRSMKDKKPTVVNFKINFDPKSARSSKGVMAAFLAILATIPLLISIFNLTRL